LFDVLVKEIWTSDSCVGAHHRFTLGLSRVLNVHLEAA